MAGADAVSITNSLIEFLVSKGLDPKKMMGLGSDGAAVMTGARGGVGKRLKDDHSWFLVHIHCVAHR